MNSAKFTRPFFKMMVQKKIFLFGLVLILMSGANAQDKGIHFEHGSTWKAILATAKKEKKYVFVDCFTTWCGPCKYMSATIFPKEEVGTFFNQHFISAKFQLDSTSKDGEEIKKQYADAAFIAKAYNIRAYPTYLFFSPDGELVHQELGSSEADVFIAKGANAINPEKQYFTLVKKYQAGNREPLLLKNLAIIARDASDQAAASEYAKAYLATKPDLENKETLRFIYETTTSSHDEGFSMMLKNPAKFETVVDREELQYALSMFIARDEAEKINYAFQKFDTTQWETYSTALAKLYPDYADQILVGFKTSTFGYKKDWKSYASAVDQYAKSKYINNTQLNEFAWTIFKNCNDKKLLTTAAAWSKQSFEKETKQNATYMDTYANLLYKLGQKEDALSWEQKAMAADIAQGHDTIWEQEVIGKIKKGLPTW